MSATPAAPRPGLWQHTLLGHLWHEFQLRWRFKYTLPQVHTLTLEGVKLDVSKLSSVMKNNLLLGRYEVQERLMAQRCITPADVVLEVGGAIGFIGLFCQLRLGVTRYTTVEANPDTAEMLQRNYALNGRTPVLWNLALAAADGQITLNIGNEFWANSLLANAGGTRAVSVPACSLATLVRRLPEPPTAFIMDIEGAEQFVDFRQLPDSVRKIIVELHPALIGHQKTYAIIAGLVNLGFHVEHEEGGTYLFLRA